MQGVALPSCAALGEPGLDRLTGRHILPIPGRVMARIHTDVCVCMYMLVTVQPQETLAVDQWISLIRGSSWLLVNHAFIHLQTTYICYMYPLAYILRA